ncbi:MAG: LicD family protein [Oscillospiraceae bacterium]|nr:LicD family protein [Oscillospiraceae bacterium]
MIQLDQQTLRRLQFVELELLVELDRIAKKHDIPYRIIAGTMLGAVRHGGFIPWDDDADVAMLREDYERFREACAAELDPERFYFQDHVTTPGYRWGYGKLRRRDSVFLREHQEHMPYEQGVFIDVFPLDAVPDSRALRTVENFECFLVRKLLWSRVGKRADRSAGMRALYALLDKVPERAVFSWYDRLVERSRRRESGWVRILTFPTPNREYGYRREWYADGEPILFEGHTFSGVSNADAYLHFKFGDYWTPPPPEARKTHPVSEIRLP